MGAAAIGSRAGGSISWGGDSGHGGGCSGMGSGSGDSREVAMVEAVEEEWVEEAATVWVVVVAMAAMEVWAVVQVKAPVGQQRRWQ